MRQLHLLLVLSISLLSCNKQDADGTLLVGVHGTFSQTTINKQEIILNPSGFAPLCCRIMITTSVPTRAKIRVAGKTGMGGDAIHSFDSLSTVHQLDVLGLYASFKNLVELTLVDANNNDLGTSNVFVTTKPLYAGLPQIRIDQNSAAKRPGMNFVSYLGNDGSSAMRTPFIFDEYGDIRWYLDYSSSPLLKTLNYDVGIERLKNGNLYFGDISTASIYEINMMGEILNTWPLTGYNFHHEVKEKPNGNFLVSVSKIGLITVEDHVIEIDRTSKAIINTWDLRSSMQQSRTDLTADYVDWMHINDLWYDASDNTILVSGRTQGVVKLDQSNKVVWLMAPHKGWGLAGDGTDLNTKLLTPLDAAGNKILDTAVLNGSANHADFEWNWCQHAAKLMPNGNLSLFDNGDERNFSDAGPYSRAVEYKVDPVNKTVKQVWTYGKERGKETYSQIVSDVDYFADVNHFIFSPGASSIASAHYGKIIEVEPTSNTVLFEATITEPASANIVITFHRTERLSLYP